MIVKDEEDILDRALQSVKGFPDEIIIVDTGSSDNTMEISRKWTEKVFAFEWVEDFSAARNYTFEQATMDYIFWLDADDVVNSNNLKKLIHLKRTLNPSFDAVRMDYHTTFDSYGNVTTTARRIRLIKRKSPFRWIGVVHEDLSWEGKGGNPTILESDIIIIHKKMKPSTEKRNLQIYEKHLAKGLTLTTQDIFHYAQELKGDKQYEKAIGYYEEFLRKKNNSSSWRTFTYNQLATCYHLIGDTKKELEITLQSFAEGLPLPEFCCRLGEHFVKKKEYDAAIFWYELAVNVPCDKNIQGSTSETFRTWFPNKQLALCYLQLGQYSKVYRHYKKALSFRAGDEEMLRNLKLVKELMDKKKEKKRTGRKKKR